MSLFDIAPDPETPQVVERGEGVSDYRARKPPEAILVNVCGFDEGILVLRCHDGDVARHALRKAVREGTISIDDVPEPTFAGESDAPSAQIWVRWVPEDPAHPVGSQGSYERELRGTIGATPAVLFARPNHPSTTTPKGDNLS